MTEKMYHIQLSAEMIQGAEYVLLPGDPGRVEKTARHLDKNAIFLAQNREFTSWLATVAGKKVLVCSTGIGGPSVSIALEELAKIGLKYFYRIGTTGVIQPDITLPCLIITSGAVRLDGASEHYAPIEYPAVADLDMTVALVEAAKELGKNYRVGVTASSDSFYPGQERYDTFTGYVPRHFRGSLAEWQKLKVLNYEMEAATVLTIVSTFGLKAGVICAAVVSRVLGERPDDQILAQAEKDLAEVIKRALEIRLTT